MPQQSVHHVALTGESNLSLNMGKSSSERSKNPVISQEKNQQRKKIDEAMSKNNLTKQSALYLSRWALQKFAVLHLCLVQSLPDWAETSEEILMGSLPLPDLQQW